MRFSSSKSTADLWEGKEPKPEPYTALPEGKILGAERGGDFKKGSMTSCVKGTCELPSSTSPPSRKSPYPSIHPCVKLEELAPTRSVEPSLLWFGLGLFSKHCFSPR